MEQRYDFRRRMTEVHRKGIRDDAVAATYPGLLVTEAFSILLPRDAGRVMTHAAHDLADYFAISQGITVPVVGEETASPTIRLAVLPLPEAREARAYRIEVTEEGVTVTANSEAGVFAGTVYLEELMNERRGPRLPYGSLVRRPLFSPRMVHSGYELDGFPAAYMNAVAHAGFDTLLVYVREAGVSAFGESDFNSVIEMAEGYGLGVYAYSYIVSEKHPDDEGAEDYYESTYGRLFREHPGFRGVVFVGESCEFPSHDPRAYPHLFRDHKRLFPDEIPPKKVFARNFPVSDYPDWLNLVKRVIYRYRPDADIIFWSYNWGGRPQDVRVALIDSLPADISLEATFEMYEPIPAPEGISEMATDYTIAIPGPGRYFLSEAEAAARRGLRLYTISNTAGTTWDVGVVPYIPAPEAWAERCEKLLECHRLYGLTGLMEGHHYGFYPSFIAELTKEMGWEPRRPFGEQLRAIAIREFGEENLERVLTAWHHASEGIRHKVPTVQDQYGPLRVGPSYPLVTTTRWVHRSRPGMLHGGGRITYTGYGMYPGFPGARCLEDYRRVFYEIGEFLKMKEEYDLAADLFREVAESLAGRPREEAGRMAAHLFFMARTAETTVNVKRWSLLRHYAEELAGIERPVLTESEDFRARALAHYAIPDLAPATLLAAASLIADRECENARRTLPAVDYDSRLGYEPSMDYMGDREHILWKCECTEEAVRELEALLARV